MYTLCRNCFIISDNNFTICQNCNSQNIISHKELNKLNIAHIDCDAFYASIHKRDNPEIRNKPVIIGGGARGVVATACYIARSYGVKSAMPMFEAKRLCKNAIIIKPDIDLYKKEAQKIRSIMNMLTPAVEPVSIDEAYIDLSGTYLLHKMYPAQLLAKLAKDIQNEVGITISIGLSYNRFLAKTASDMDKPKGFFIIGHEDVKNILWDRNIGFLHGIGKQIEKKFNVLGYYKVQDIANASPNELLAQFGSFGKRVHDLANGIDNTKIENNHERKSISKETTFANDVKDFDILAKTLKELSLSVAKTARDKNLAGYVINLKLKTKNFTSISRQIQISTPTQTGRIIFETLEPILEKEMKRAPFRLIGAGLSSLCSGENSDRGDLINNDAPKRHKLEKLMDSINNKYGKDVIKSIE